MTQARKKLLLLAGCVGRSLRPQRSKIARLLLPLLHTRGQESERGAPRQRGKFAPSGQCDRGVTLDSPPPARSVLAPEKEALKEAALGRTLPPLGGNVEALRALRGAMYARSVVRSDTTPPPREENDRRTNVRDDRNLCAPCLSVRRADQVTTKKSGRPLARHRCPYVSIRRFLLGQRSRASLASP